MLLYNHVLECIAAEFYSPDRDRYIQSKGIGRSIIVVLAGKGFFPETDLKHICKYKSHYIGHPTKKVKGVEQNTGALGSWLTPFCRNSIAAKMDQKITVCLH
jgi:transketolase